MKRKRMFSERPRPWTWRKRFMIVAICMVIAPPAAIAAMAVVDAGANAKLSAILSELKRHTAYLRTIAEMTAAELYATGKKGSVEFGQKADVNGQLRRWSGVITDPDELAGTLRTGKGQNLDFTNVEAALASFEPLMRIIKPELGKGELFTISRRQEETIRTRRELATEEAGLLAMAVAETGLDNYSRTMSDLGELVNANDEVTTLQERLALLGAIMIKSAVIEAERNLLLAVRMKVVGAGSLRQLPVVVQPLRYELGE